jgi:hypothetical protein
VAHPASQSVSTVSPLLRVKCQKRVNNHFFPLSAETLTVCSNTATDCNSKALSIPWPEFLEMFRFECNF